MTERHLVYRGPGGRAVLSTESASSSHGVPVLVVGGEALGPGDMLPSGFPAAELVRRFVNAGNAGAGRWGPRSAVALAAARAFLSGDPAWAGEARE